MDAETQDLLRGSIRDLFATGGSDVVAGLRALGWEDVVAEDEHTAIDLLFSEQGAAGQASSALDTVAYAVDEDGAAHPVVHPLAATTTAHVTGDGVEVDGVLLASPTGPAVIATAAGDTFLVDAETLAGATMSVAGFHPGSGLRRVKATLATASLRPIQVQWNVVATAARRALAAELVGNGRAMLRLATEQIADRQQFGRPIGANQSPRHRLAEAYALLGGAAELVRMASQSETAWDATVAKAYAGQAADVTGRACLQVCGAIGLTTEHSLPGFVQRARILDALYGGWSSTIADIGAQLVVAGKVPPGDLL